MHTHRQDHHQHHSSPIRAAPHAQRPGATLRSIVAAICTGIGITTAGTAMADSTATKDAEARYQQEMAACASGRSHQDTATCQREAAHALAEARRGQLATGQANTAANATQRCTLLPADQRADCVARITRGDAIGSVGAGGVLREHTTIVPVPAPAP